MNGDPRRRRAVIRRLVTLFSLVAGLTWPGNPVFRASAQSTPFPPTSFFPTTSSPGDPASSSTTGVTFVPSSTMATPTSTMPPSSSTTGPPLGPTTTAVQGPPPFPATTAPTPATTPPSTPTTLPVVTTTPPAGDDAGGDPIGSDDAPLVMAVEEDPPGETQPPPVEPPLSFFPPAPLEINSAPATGVDVALPSPSPPEPPPAVLEVAQVQTLAVPVAVPPSLMSRITPTSPFPFDTPPATVPSTANATTTTSPSPAGALSTVPSSPASNAPATSARIETAAPSPDLEGQDDARGGGTWPVLLGVGGLLLLGVMVLLLRAQRAGAN